MYRSTAALSRHIHALMHCAKLAHMYLEMNHNPAQSLSKSPHLPKGPPRDNEMLFDISGVSAAAPVATAGKGYVVFSTREEASSAVLRLQGREVDGSPLRLELSQDEGQAAALVRSDSVRAKERSPSAGKSSGRPCDIVFGAVRQEGRAVLFSGLFCV